MQELAEYIEGVPNISGAEATIEAAMNQHQGEAIYLPRSGFDFGNIRSCCANALHMHQPLIPAGGDDLRTADVISNLKHMMDNQHIGDNHNATVFHWCYKRLGEFIPQLIQEGKQPRIMLEYSGTLFHGMRHLGLDDVFDSLDHHLQPGLLAHHRMAWRSVGARRSSLHPRAGLPAARAGLAAPLRVDLRPGSAQPRARFLALGDGAAQPPRCGLRICQDAERLWLSMGAGARTLG